MSWSYVGPCSGPGAPPDENQLLDGSTRNFTLTGLRPNSQYSVTLEAMNNKGSASSQIIVNIAFEGKLYFTTGWDTSSYGDFCMTTEFGYFVFDCRSS